MAKGDFADVGGNYDETLLHEGKYGEWFWSQMSANARTFLKSARNFDADNLSFKCHRCKQTKPALEFTKSSHVMAGGNHRQCNKCSLNLAKTQGEPRRWENPEGAAWVAEASCKGADPEVFFPEDATSFRRADAPWRQFCPSCPVAELCEQFGHDSWSLGVFGGKLYTKFGGNSIRKVDPSSPGRGRPRKDS